jgi:hypothetical protein
MIDGVLPAASTSICSLLRALSCPSPYAMGIEIPRIPSRQYTMSSSSFVLRCLAHRPRSVVLNSFKGQLRSAARGMSVISCMSWSSDVLSPICRPSHEKNLTVTGAISSWSVHPRVNHDPSPGIRHRFGQIVLGTELTFCYDKFLSSISMRLLVWSTSLSIVSTRLPDAPSHLSSHLPAASL